MIASDEFVAETFLEELFGQIPNINYAGKDYPVKFGWGNQDDLNLYMRTESGNQTPLIWMIQDKVDVHSTEAGRRVRLIIAKSSEHKAERNPIVWKSEFVQVLNPLLVNVLKCLRKSGLTTLVGDRYSVYRQANYSEYERDEMGKVSKTQAKTIDHWNVIQFEADILFRNIGNCIPQINFNL